MIHSRNKFHMHSSSGPLIIAIKPKVNPYISFSRHVVLCFSKIYYHTSFRYRRSHLTVLLPFVGN